MTKCEHWGSGWCYAPVDVKTNAIGKFGVCKLPEDCPYLKSQNKMTDMFISIDGEATLGTKCPTHKLEIKKMNEIQQTEGEIKVLQAKLEFLKEMENHKSPVEEAFKRVYGYYQEVCERSIWIAFKKGYDASQKDYKVGEYQPTPQEPTKDKVSLYKRFEDEGAYGQIYFDNALKVVRCFLIDEAVIENEDHEYITFTLQKSLLEVPND